MKTEVCELLIAVLFRVAFKSQDLMWLRALSGGEEVEGIAGLC